MEAEQSFLYLSVKKENTVKGSRSALNLSLRKVECLYSIFRQVCNEE